MAITMHVDIVSAEESVFSGTASFVLARSSDGELGVMPRHVPLLAQLQPGELMLRDEFEEEHFYYASGGLIEVQPYVVTVLADTASRARDLDEAAAQQAKRRAEQAIENRSGEMDYARAQAELAEAAAQLRTIQTLRRRKGQG